MTYPEQARRLLASAVDRRKQVKEAAQEVSRQIKQERVEAAQSPQQTDAEQ